MSSVKEILKARQPKRKKWGGAWDHYAPRTFVDIGVAKSIRAINVLKMHGAKGIAEAIDNLGDGIDYLLKHRKNLEQSSNARKRLAYVCYPYSDNPKVRSKEIQSIVMKLIEEHPDIVPIVPHYAFDALFNFPKAYNDYPFMMMWEFEIISRCDVVVIASKHRSIGMVWEEAFAKRLDIPIMEFYTE